MEGRPFLEACEALCTRLESWENFAFFIMNHDIFSVESVELVKATMTDDYCSLKIKSSSVIRVRH